MFFWRKPYPAVLGSQSHTILGALQCQGLNPQPHNASHVLDPLSHMPGTYNWSLIAKCVKQNVTTLSPGKKKKDK